MHSFFSPYLTSPLILGLFQSLNLILSSALTDSIDKDE